MSAKYCQQDIRGYIYMEGHAVFLSLSRVSIVLIVVIVVIVLIVLIAAPLPQ